LRQKPIYFKFFKMISIDFFEGNFKKHYQISRAAILTKTACLILLAELALILNCVLIDHIIFKSDKFRIFVNEISGIRIPVINALLDNFSHAFIGFLSVFIATVTQLNLYELFFCTAISSLMDLDHFISAKSLHLDNAISLGERPFLHDTLALFIVNVLIYIALSYYDSKKRYISVLIFLAWFSHHVRDANRHGLWFGSFYETQPLRDFEYIFIVCALPLIVKYAIAKLQLK